LVPAAIDDAAAPAMPMRMPGPPSWISNVPASNCTFLVCSLLIVPMPPAIMMGLW